MILLLITIIIVLLIFIHALTSYQKNQKNSIKRNKHSSNIPKPPLSFIILRHLGNENQNIYWNVCYDNIRKIYKTEPIYIIDDNSKYPPKRIGEKLINTKIINSEFPPNRGELLPYYYF